MGQFKIITQNVSTVLFEIMPVRHSDKMTAHASLLVPFERLGLPFLFLCKQSWRWFSTKTRNFFARDLATEEAMTRCGDCDFRQSQLSGYKIAHIWHVRYRRLNSPAFTKSARSRDFLAFPLGVGRKINQSSWAILLHDFSKWRKASKIVSEPKKKR